MCLIFPLESYYFSPLWLIGNLWRDILIYKYHVSKSFPLDLASIEASCLNQSLQQLKSDGFPTPIIIPHLLVSTQYSTVSMSPPYFPISSFELYLSVHYQYGHLDYGFLLLFFLMAHYYSVPDLASRSPFKLTLNVLSSSYTFPALAWESAFSKESWFILKGMVLEAKMCILDVLLSLQSFCFLTHSVENMYTSYIIKA